MKRIVLTGAECTGKSTLTQALSGYYGEPWTPEYVREYVNQITRELSSEDLELIAKGQLASEDANLGAAKQFILHDTNLLSSIIYANHYFGTVIDWVNEAFLQRDYTLYLLCTPQDIEWQNDPGQRDSPAAREQLQAKFKETLDQLKLPYQELKGDSTARFSEAIQVIDAVLKT
ncbi:ATP-binding protein [Coraliomargarita sp. SDUM461004]|uniref:ATP-binding protein n=1 Tax=Thalassobacterium sedimentorum TaxID=3041258 RepID=A0ABU1AI27_9BACT|nr:ATP-binding protein [Coraliomargarita sp. SDUM461004]MDQ8194472.1 ATP-binding protein [Coraliomargarita sp. SDUM461004]